MPNTKSAKKRVGTSQKQHARNKSVKSGLSTSRRKLFAAAAGGDKTKTAKCFSEYCSVLDKAVKKGVLKANAANRRKSRAAAKISAPVTP